jgi:hypothetical protein
MTGRRQTIILVAVTGRSKEVNVLYHRVVRKIQFGHGYLGDILGRSGKHVSKDGLGQKLCDCLQKKDCVVSSISLKGAAATNAITG